MSHFTIDMWEDDLILGKRVIRVRDEKRYVQYEMTGEERLWFDQDLSYALQREWMRYILSILCAKWKEMHGEELYAIPPIQEGTGWFVTNEPPIVDGEVAQGKLPSYLDRRALLDSIREVVECDKRKAIEGR